MSKFDGIKYTQDAILEELALIERHARDGSAVEGGCACIEEKHLLTLAGLASEGVTLANNEREKQYYMKLASWARAKRNEILAGDFDVSAAKCERKVAKCVGEGQTEAECRRVHCK